MPRRRGIQGEVLASLAVLVVTAIGLLTAFLVQTHASQRQQQEGLLGRALVHESPAALLGVEHSVSGMRWALFEEGADGGAGELPEGLSALVARSRALGQPIFSSGPPWKPLLFATPLDGAGRVAGGWLPAVVSPFALFGLVSLDILVFFALGAYLLRRRVTMPLRRLAAATHELGQGEWSVRVPAEGAREVADLASDFNAMGEALEQRTLALEKAVGELRATNSTLRQAREGLDRAERLAAVGTLAAGVAHEVGNPMGAVLAFLDLARREGERDGLGEHGMSLLEKAGREGERVRVILRQLLDFSRPPQSQRAPVSLEASAERALSLVRAQKRYAEIVCEVVCETPLPTVLADEGLVGQVLLNLVLNAADAIGEGPGRVRIVLRPTLLARRAGDGPETNTEAALQARCDAVECVVEDDGPGVPESDRERIFDPFFTTKAPGEGTGLGLANAQRITEELGGVLRCESSPELGGAAFAMRLPLGSSASGSDAGSQIREH